MFRMASNVLLAVDMSELKNELLRRVNIDLTEDGEPSMSSLSLSDHIIPDSDKRDGESSPEGMNGYQDKVNDFDQGELHDEDDDVSSGDYFEEQQEGEVDIQEWERLGKFPASIAMPSNAAKVKID